MDTEPSPADWVKPDFSEYETPMEVTAYSGRA
nr:pyrroloquinoline quinone precursor peptide PqqA [Kutzneria albida]